MLLLYTMKFGDFIYFIGRSLKSTGESEKGLSASLLIYI